MCIKCDLKINAFSCSQFEEVFLTKREHYEKLVNGKFSKFLIYHLLLFYEYIIPLYH